MDAAPDSRVPPRPPRRSISSRGVAASAPAAARLPRSAGPSATTSCSARSSAAARASSTGRASGPSGRLVALKMMLDQSASSPADLSRFVLEAQATGELHHPGVVAIHAWGVHDGHPFYTMDFVPGRPLHKVLAGGPAAARPGRPLPRRHGPRPRRGPRPGHRPPRPEAEQRHDRLGRPAARPRLRPRQAPPHRPPRQPRRRPPRSAARLRVAAPARIDAARVSAPVTEKGAILGTPSYMAPEQVRAEHERVGPPADVHALGAIFYEMLTGRPPFLGDSTYATLMQVLDHEPAPMRSLRPQVPPTLEALCRPLPGQGARQRYPDAGGAGRRPGAALEAGHPGRPLCPPRPARGAGPGRAASRPAAARRPALVRPRHPGRAGGLAAAADRPAARRRRRPRPPAARPGRGRRAAARRAWG